MQPVILAGGSGSRLWPLSRQHHPKQFLSLAGQQSLLQQCLQRAAQISQVHALLIGREEHRFLLAQQLQETGLQGRIVLEPEGRNTAASLVLAALDAVERGTPCQLLLALPADQLIEPIDSLAQAAESARPAAESGQLCLFGVVPDHPATGYGYILPDPADPVQVERFIEKPDAVQAADLIERGAFWNAGVLLTRADTLLATLTPLQPDLIAACRHAWQQRTTDLDFIRVGVEPFLTCPEISIDHALLEHASSCHVTALQAHWQDLGSWAALEQQLPETPDGCRAQGKVTRLHCHNTLFMGGERLIAALGLSNLLVVDTPDALLLADKNYANEMKQLVAELQQQDRSELINHPRVHRPWGFYEHLLDGPGFRVKLISVSPGAALSLQRHRYRAEHWVVLSGHASISRDAEHIELGANQSIAIAQGQLHRLSNNGTEPLLILEVQSGDVLDEADIERLDDRYGRG
ncbi:mannose-1-phosphate guanylyltransferase/mannose-6-phosphate isomerase [Marinobacterium sp. MBR-111]|jgi:mannose-1-phosphate guanylyltransferase/mannose-6-phosphate isomerase|uniref:mannose-1-phosphate guanylyltransferase/mannose-6-phosphate isomerase n=1 Tax=Marinobacterium sp. MBR-111 TaxID=3156463 RepID=UPI00339256B3